ncbi:putative tRNA N6-adenosine threonylcarbamoyltransferase, mitochondrial [Smittium culicis]|uniref:N(6)-L-threonylcarbamoyladenine synthase n=1 Tax=Smittium culicis TaxID=133412 RepID=A0A1R1YFV9_9FUNG|nr:putative tRNA N6-adenosine threonylcarbamoyltransferase, mitochondrial [Smittium culicis]
MLLVANSVNSYTCLGTTLDDSIGEVFDKVSRQLDIPSLKPDLESMAANHQDESNNSAGEALERLATFGNPSNHKLPLPMSKADTSSSLNYSFSGLKSATFRLIAASKDNSFADKADIAACFQTTATNHLVSKLTKSLLFTKSELGVSPKSIVVSGGVASNKYINSRLTAFAHSNNLLYFSPPKHLCTDNGVMIAWAGIERFKLGLIDPYSITFKQRWPLQDLGNHV